MNLQPYNNLMLNSKNKIIYKQSSIKFPKIYFEKEKICNILLKKNNSSKFQNIKNLNILGNITTREKNNSNEFCQKFQQIRENQPKIKLYNLLFQNPKKYDLEFKELFPLNYTRKNFSFDNILFDNDYLNLNDFNNNNKNHLINNKFNSLSRRYFKIKNLKNDIFQILENKFLEYKYLKKLYKKEKEKEKEIENQKINIDKKNKEKRIKLIKINTIKKRYDLSKLILKNTPLSITLKNSNDEGTQTYRFLNEKY